MTARVYQFGLRPPTEGMALVRAQLRAAHDYANELTAIERGRRWALRQLDDTDEVREAVALVRAATKSTKRAAIASLRDARRVARERRCDGGRWAVPEEDAAMYPYSPLYEVDRIGLLEAELLRQARAATTAFWGTYLDVEAAHRQSRQAPLYGDDAITPNDPKFVRWTGVDERGVRVGRLPESPEGHVGVQLQGGLPTADALGCLDARVRLKVFPLPEGVTSKRGQKRRRGELSIRVGSEGRAPVWATWPILYDRHVPDAATWKWVRVSLRHRGRHEVWTCEISVQDVPMSRDLDRTLSGTIFVEWEWSPLDDDSIRVARWTDDRGGSGDVVVPARIARGIRKPDGHRAVRDIVANDMRPRLQTAIREAKEAKPVWLIEAGNTLHLWQSHRRLHALHRHWAAEAPGVVSHGYAILCEWVRRDRHLWDYESGARSNALRSRRDFYRCIARRWSELYRTAVLSNQDLSREARFGADADRRQTVGIYELRESIRNTFGRDALDGYWRKGDGGDDGIDPSPGSPSTWCERARDAWIAGGARADAMFSKRKEQTSNAWAQRKAKAATKQAGGAGARKPDQNAAE